MDWTWYLFGFEGRINRAKYWLAGLVILSLMVAAAAAGYLLLTISFATHAMETASGSGKVTFALGLDDIVTLFDPQTWRGLSFGKLSLLLAKAAVSGFLLWIFLATSIKRLHDRDRSGWWMVPFVAVPYCYDHLSDLLPDSNFMLIPAMIAFVLLVWGFVELYFLSGSKATNRFGPNPLGVQQTRAPSVQDRLRETTPGDSRSPIEMVPHTASPPPVWRVKPGP